MIGEKRGPSHSLQNKADGRPAAALREKKRSQGRTRPLAPLLPFGWGGERIPAERENPGGEKKGAQSCF